MLSTEVLIGLPSFPRSTVPTVSPEKQQIPSNMKTERLTHDAEDKATAAASDNFAVPRVESWFSDPLVAGELSMKQVLQQARSGEIAVLDVPAPKLLPGCVLVRMAASLVSAGTERASCEFANKNLLQKAKARPDLVREVISKVRRDGLFSAVAAVRSRLDQPGALGYSSSGTVIGIGEGVTDLKRRRSCCLRRSELRRACGVCLHPSPAGGEDSSGLHRDL